MHVHVTVVIDLISLDAEIIIMIIYIDLDNTPVCGFQDGNLFLKAVPVGYNLQI